MKKAALLLTAFLLSALAGCGDGGEASSVQHGTYTDSGEASSVQHGIYTDGVVESSQRRPIPARSQTATPKAVWKWRP